MLAQKKLLTSLGCLTKNLAQRSVYKFSTNDQTVSSATKEATADANKNNVETPFKFHENWQEEARKQINE